jgi:hypothetical protein
MIHSAKWLVLAGLLATGLVLVSGCDRGSGRPPINTSAITGNWIELADQSAANPRMQGATKGKKTFRYLVINPDNTFEFSLRNKSGEPVGEGVAKGSWALKGNTLVFEVTENTFDEQEEAHEWAPESSVGINRRSIKGTQTEVLSVVDLSGLPTAYVRAD